MLNSLDGFNIQPRITIPFSGPIDVSTVSSSNIFLVGPGDHVIGINQPVWEPLTNTLYVESDDAAQEDSTYLLVVTRGVHDANGAPTDATSFRHDLNFGQTKDPAVKAYRKALLDALHSAFAAGVRPDDIADASLFTTQSVTAISEKIRDQIRSAPGRRSRTSTSRRTDSRTVFPVTPSLTIKWNTQMTAAGGSRRRPSPALPPCSSSRRTSRARSHRWRTARSPHPTTRTHRSSFRRSGRRRACLRSRAPTSSCSRCSCRPGPSLRAAGP